MGLVSIYISKILRLGRPCCCCVFCFCFFSLARLCCWVRSETSLDCNKLFVKWTLLHEWQAKLVLKARQEWFCYLITTEYAEWIQKRQIDRTNARRDPTCGEISNLTCGWTWLWYHVRVERKQRRQIEKMLNWFFYSSEWVEVLLQVYLYTEIKLLALRK